ncbi:MAG: response regulator [Cyclobacteriaceae bacterium]
MDKLNIICIDDQRDVLNALTEDLKEFESTLRIEACESVEEAWEIIESIDAAGDFVSLVITDQVMPVNTGVDILKKLNEDSRFDHTRKILLTGLATHQDTIEAINSAKLDHYIEKPWEKAQLEKVIKQLLTKFILSKGLDYQKYPELIDQDTLFEQLRKTT